jgi:poly(A) polymerase
LDRLKGRIDPARIAAAREGGGGEARRLVERLRGAGCEAYLAGGCVRDFLLGRPPGDFDVATDARPEKVEALFEKTIPIGRAFGTVAVVGERETVEVTTFRDDGRYLDARHPESVTFRDAPRDAQRRDFTVNALFADPVTGEVLDYVRGIPDLEARRLRTVGDPEARFREDALRVLRLPRFATQLDFEIEPGTFEGARRAVGGLARISAERVRVELVKMWTGPQPGRALHLLDEIGVLPVVLPEIEAMKGVAQPPEFHPEGDVFVHTALTLDRLDRRTPVLAFAALLHDVGKPATFRIADRIRFDGHAALGAALAQTILRRLRFSNREIEAIVRLVADHLRLPDVLAMREGRRRLFLRRPDLEDLLALHRADCLASHGKLDAEEGIRRALALLAEEALRPPPLLRGRDLLALGYRPGPLFRVILSGVEEAQLEDRLRTREEAVEWVRERFGPPPGPGAGTGPGRKTSK